MLDCGFECSVLTTMLVDIDFAIRSSWTAWNQTINAGFLQTAGDGGWASTSQGKMGVGALDNDSVVFRISTLPAPEGVTPSACLYYAFTSEKRSLYFPFGSPSAQEGTPDPEPGLDPETSLEPDTSTDPGGTQDLPSSGEGSWDGTYDLAPLPDQGTPAPDPEEEEPDPGDDEFDGPLAGVTLALDSYCAWRNMGTEITFSWSDQGTVHVMTATPGKPNAIVTVFKEEWEYEGRDIADPSIPGEIVTPGLYAVTFPGNVEEFDYAWDSHQQEVLFISREAQVSTLGGNSPPDANTVDLRDGGDTYEVTCGSFKPPTYMSHYGLGGKDGTVIRYGQRPQMLYTTWDTVTTRIHPLRLDLPSGANVRISEDAWSSPQILNRPRNWRFVQRENARGWEHYSIIPFMLILDN